LTSKRSVASAGNTLGDDITTGGIGNISAMFGLGNVRGNTIVTNILSTFVVIVTISSGDTDWDTTSRRSTSNSLVGR
jgi:hypothetical protein